MRVHAHVLDARELPSWHPPALQSTRNGAPDLLASPCSQHVQESSEDESEEGSSRVDSEVRPCWQAGPRVPAAMPSGWVGWSLGGLLILDTAARSPSRL